MKKNIRYIIQGFITSIIYMLPFIFFPEAINRNEDYFRIIFSNISFSPSILFFLREFIIYIILGSLFFNFFLRDIDKVNVVIFPREKTRSKWFKRKIIGLFIEYLIFWISFLLFSIIIFCASNSIFPNHFFLKNLIYLLSTSFLCYFLFLIIMNILTLCINEYLSFFLSLFFYFTQYFFIFIIIKKAIFFLPYNYSKYSLFDNIYLYFIILFLEFLLITGILIFGYFISKFKKFKMGEDL